MHRLAAYGHDGSCRRCRCTYYSQIHGFGGYLSPAGSIENRIGSPLGKWVKCENSNSYGGFFLLLVLLCAANLEIISRLRRKTGWHVARYLALNLYRFQRTLCISAGSRAFDAHSAWKYFSHLKQSMMTVGEIVLLSRLLDMDE